TGSALLIERFIPSTLMGLIIGWVAYRTGSVIPGIVIHFVHNGLLNMVLYYQDQLSFLGQGFDNQTHLPPLWLGGASMLVITGGLLIWWSSLRPRTSDDVEALAVAG
ncbi:MAG: CPBP family glutamic-type intramembrane protease, partial [Rubripirellula sp.]